MDSYVSLYSQLMLRRFEGWRSRLYRDSLGVESIGFGFNLRDRDMPKEVGNLWLDLEEGHSAVQAKKLFGEEFFGALEGARQAAIVNLIFNMGIGSLKTFKRMIRAIRALDWESAAFELVTRSDGSGPSKYVLQVGERRAFFYRDLLLTGEFLDIPG